MAFDGITIANVVQEMKDVLIGGRIYKIAQPEPDEMIFTIKQPHGQYRLLISAGASLPLLYVSAQNKPSPMTAPNFCMLLRKHLQNGRIVDITQPGLERIVTIEMEHLNEMGDLCRKKLIVEIMGKYSNIIFCDDNDIIIDSIKRVSALVSSVREVLPGKMYFIADTTHKKDAMTVTKEEFLTVMKEAPMPAFKAFYTSFTGISPIMGQEICHRAGVDGELPTAALSDEEITNIYKEWTDIRNDIEDGKFTPYIVYEGKKPVEFAAFDLTIYEDGVHECKPYNSMSEVLETYFAQKNAQIRIRQRSTDLQKIVHTALERNVKKYDVQLQQMKDTEKRDTYRVYGELLHTYGYSAAPGDKSLEAVNYYTGETVKIPLDPTLTAAENAKKYFDKYNKMKRTYEALSKLTKEVGEEIEHLKSIEVALQIAAGEEDLLQIREELQESGYMRKRNGGKKMKVTSRPFHYISRDGYDIYVGKNNLQNEELTFKFADGGDWWFHAKGCPGSHVIVKNKGRGELPDATYEDAARLAAHYSSAGSQNKAEVDYVEKKQVKKPNGGKPGFVVYYTNYSMMADTDISDIEKADA